MNFRMRYVLFLLALIFLSSCFGGNGNNSQANSENESTKENKVDKKAPDAQNEQNQDDQKAKTGISQDKDFKLATNSRFNFRLAVPKEWEIQERSANQDGFFLKTNNEDADLRVYGQQLSEATKDLNRPDCKEEVDFSFQDGETGIKCLKENKLIYYREKNNKRVTFYIKAKKEWQEKHADKLNKIAKSLVFTEDEEMS